MNKIKLPRKSVALFCAVLIAAFSGGALFSANAGVSKISVVSDTAIRNGIATNVWINEGNVKGENGKVLFDESVGENGRIVVMTKIKDVFQSGFSKNLDASFTFCIDDIPDGARFAVAFGLPKVLSALGTAGSSEVYFVRQNGRLAAGVAVYGDEGAAEIAVPKAVSGLSFWLYAFPVKSSNESVAAGVSALRYSQASTRTEERVALHLPTCPIATYPSAETVLPAVETPLSVVWLPPLGVTVAIRCSSCKTTASGSKLE